MKLFEAEQKIKEQLKNIYEAQEAENIADLASEYITSLCKNERRANKEILLTPEQLSIMNKTLQQLLSHEPIQYVMNKCWFFGMELFIDHSVLIPRPETEELVSWVIDDVKKKGYNVFNAGSMKADVTSQLKIIDVGTGSGCIALALKKNMPRAEVWGCDISEEALNIARRNGSSLNIRVDFQGVNFLDHAQQKHLPSVDIVVSNPPYVPLRDKDQMAANVLNFEPHTALFVSDEDPPQFYRALANFGKHRLHKEGTMYMEIHEGLGHEVVELFQTEGYNGVELRKDMQGKDRMVKAERGVGS
ncbi:MAG: peptide chain release factor N(5)-glutamine methyltransferase [Flavisolibacter sp.]